MRRELLGGILWLLIMTAGFAQPYIGAGYQLGLPKYTVLDDIVTRFDKNNNHLLGKMTYLNGFEVVLGKYGERTIMEAKIGFNGRTLKSNVPNNYIENALVSYQHWYMSYAFGYRPFRPLFSVGTQLNCGFTAVRYSLGGNFIYTTVNFASSANFFVDYAFKLRLKKRRQPYLFRLRPYYQVFMLPTDLRTFERRININNTVDFGRYVQDFSHPGIQFSVLVPIGKEKEAKARRKADREDKSKLETSPNILKSF